MPWTHDSERTFDPDEAHNLRRKRQRDTADCILARADFLPPPDRTLILAVYEDSRTVSELARMMGRDPRGLRRRIRRLIDRMASPRFAFVAARRDQWSSTRRRVATANEQARVRGGRRGYFTRVALTSSPHGPVSPRVETQRAW